MASLGRGAARTSLDKLGYPPHRSLKPARHGVWIAEAAATLDVGVAEVAVRVAGAALARVGVAEVAAALRIAGAAKAAGPDTTGPPGRVKPRWAVDPLVEGGSSSSIRRTRGVRAAEEVVGDQELASILARVVGPIVGPVLGRVEVCARARWVAALAVAPRIMLAVARSLGRRLAPRN
jgi:hypothetical protein